ncbi:hypothetical protein ACFXD5_29825, partial [Streptomyces sp. NPDC059385]
MKNDEPTVGRRALLRTAVFLGVAAASGLLTANGETGAPGTGMGSGSGPGAPTPLAGPGPHPAAGRAPRLGAPEKAAIKNRVRAMTPEGRRRP